MTVQDLTASSGDLEKVAAGQTLILDVTVTGAGNLTGATAIEFRLNNSDLTHRYVRKTLGSGCSVVDADTLRVTLAAADTTSLIGLYSYEIWVTDASSNIAPVTTGQIQFYRRAV